MIELAPEVQRVASEVDAALAKPEEQAAPAPPEPAPTERPVEPEPIPQVAEAPVGALAPRPSAREKPKPERRRPEGPHPPKPPLPKPHPPKPHAPKLLIERRPSIHAASAPPSEEHAATTAAASPGAARAMSAADWNSLVSASLNRHKRFPPGVAAGGSLTLKVAIAASGDVTGATVIASSGLPELDDAAIQAVHRASPLPPPPAGARSLTFRMNFRPR